MADSDIEGSSGALIDGCGGRMYRKKRGRDTGLARKSLLNADTEEILNEELCLSLRSTPILTITLLGAMPKSLNLSPG